MIARNRDDMVEDYENIPLPPEGFDKIIMLDGMERVVPRNIHYLYDHNIPTILERFDAIEDKLSQISRELKKKRWVPKKKIQRRVRPQTPVVTEILKTTAENFENEEETRQARLATEKRYQLSIAHAQSEDTDEHLWVTGSISVSRDEYCRDEVVNLVVGDVCPGDRGNDFRVRSINKTYFGFVVEFDGINQSLTFTNDQWIVRRLRNSEVTATINEMSSSLEDLTQRLWRIKSKHNG